MLNTTFVSPNPFIGNPDIKINLPCSSSQLNHLRRHAPLKIQACSTSFETLNRTVDGIQSPRHNSSQGRRPTETPDIYSKKTRRVFFLDVNPLCYDGNTPSLHNFAHWISLFFSQVSRSDPVIAVIDGDGGSEYRRQLLPSYKAHRRIPSSNQHSPWRRVSKDSGSWSDHFVVDVLKKLNATVVKVNGYEADDVIATLTDAVLDRGYKVVIASPDKDFKQLISEHVQIVLPMPRFDRWSFYTLKHYMTQYNCHPSSDLSLRCLVGDEVDGVPGIQHVVPGFGLKTALKLLQKHGSLEDLLKTAAVRSVGKQYVQDALTNHVDYLRRNYKVLSLRRDVDVSLEDEWLLERKTWNDSIVMSNFFELIGPKQLS